MANKARRFLIKLGKILPFVICFVVFVGYMESLYALYREDYLEYEGYLTLNTPISFWIASKMKYDSLVLFVCMVTSIAIETCVWNKLSIIYLFVQLLEKEYFQRVELYVEYIYIAVILNIMISGFFVWKGLILIVKR